MQLIKTRSGFPPQLQRVVRAVNRRLAVHGPVTVGRSLRVGRGVVVSAPHCLRVGDWVSIGPYSTIQVDGSIGDFALIGMHVQIAGRRDHAVGELGSPIALATWVGDRTQVDGDEVHVGRDVWVGGRATILGGVSVGEGAVIGAASVVTRDVPAFGVVVGNPARVVAYRFRDLHERREHSRALDSLTLTMRSSRPATSGRQAEVLIPR